MSKLDNLIKKLCPEGVQIVKLGDLEDQGLLKLGRGDVISKTDLANHLGNFPVYSSSALNDGLFGNYEKWMFEDERITWSIDGGGKFFYRIPHKYSVTNVCGWLSIIDKNTISTRYLYFALTNIWSTRTYNYTVKAHPSVIREDYLIPLPPLEIQNEIVKILDKFTELEAQLEAELEARKKQYEFYRSQLLSFTDVEEGGVRWLKLEEVAKIKNGSDHKHLQDGPYPLYGSGGVMRTVEKFSYNKPSVLIPRKGSLKNLFYLDQPFWTVDTIFYTEINDSLVHPKFLFHWLKVQELEKLDVAGGVPSLTQTILNRVMIPLPDISTQIEISDKLDAFSTLLESAKTGLPAEIAARRQQYEYYRNKLLTFKELKAS